MNILLICRYYPPEVNTVAHLFHELACGLLQRGHTVTVATSFPWHNLSTLPHQYRGKLFLKEKMDGVDVVRVASPAVGPLPWRLAIGHATTPITSFIASCFVRKPDITLISSPPLMLGIPGWLIKVFRGTPYIFGVQDLHPQCYIDQGLLKNRLAIFILEWLEKFFYRHAALITVHSPGNMRHLVDRKGVPSSMVRVLNNWIDTDISQPLPRDNLFARQNRLTEKFVVGYAGTIGLSQGMENVIEAARLLQNRTDIEFFIVGDGIDKQKLIDKTQQYQLQNVRFLGIQPKSTYSSVVASFDVGLVTLNRRVKTPTVPSKILSLMAAGRTILMSAPQDGDAPKLIVEAQAGICVGPEDPDALAQNISYLADHRNLCEQYGAQGRAYVEQNMSLNKVAREIENLFYEVVGKGARSGGD